VSDDGNERQNFLFFLLPFLYYCYYFFVVVKTVFIFVKKEGSFDKIGNGYVTLVHFEQDKMKT